MKMFQQILQIKQNNEFLKLLFHTDTDLIHTFITQNSSLLIQRHSENNTASCLFEFV